MKSNPMVTGGKDWGHKKQGMKEQLCGLVRILGKVLCKVAQLR